LYGAFCTVVENSLNIKIHAQFFKFIDLFEFLLEKSKNRPIKLGIDEFQEFLSINSSMYFDMQFKGGLPMTYLYQK